MYFSNIRHHLTVRYISSVLLLSCAWWYKYGSKIMRYYIPHCFFVSVEILRDIFISFCYLIMLPHKKARIDDDIQKLSLWCNHSSMSRLQWWFCWNATDWNTLWRTNYIPHFHINVINYLCPKVNFVLDNLMTMFPRLSCQFPFATGKIVFPKISHSYPILQDDLGRWLVDFGNICALSVRAGRRATGSTDW